MSGWEQILLLIMAGALLFFLARGIKSRKEAFSGANMSKSFRTMGLLAIGLIVFISLLVMMLRGSGG